MCVVADGAKERIATHLARQRSSFLTCGAQGTAASAEDS